MMIRTFLPGDEAAQVGIYNEAAGPLPRFKPASLDELRRRVQAADFDPGTRLFVVADGVAVGYCSFHANGRVSYPWCRAGHESHAEPLFQAVLDAMRQRGLRRAFAAYRGDWPETSQFFLNHGFRQAREMVNFVVDLVELPTPAMRLSTPMAPLRPADLPAVLALAPEVFRNLPAADLERHLFHNPYFGPESLLVVRSRSDEQPLAVGVLVVNPAYADPKQVDAAMPCFRLGAFGTEGMQVKRINGLYSFIARPGADFSGLALDLLRRAAARLDRTDLATLAAQVPSDAGHLLRFYQQYFRRQGSFPVFERDL